jgi:hypothetical protein
MAGGSPRQDGDRRQTGDEHLFRLADHVYPLGDELGQGGYGKVFASKRHGVDLAIKQFPAGDHGARMAAEEPGLGLPAGG